MVELTKSLPEHNESNGQRGRCISVFSGGCQSHCLQSWKGREANYPKLYKTWLKSLIYASLRVIFGKYGNALMWRVTFFKS